jgi:hypothetical protein
VDSEKTQLAPSHGGGGSAKKATAIEIRHLGHLDARFADSTPNALAAERLTIGVGLTAAFRRCKCAKHEQNLFEGAHSRYYTMVSLDT